VQPAKTAWDVLQLLIVPVMLVAIALYFNASQASRDRSREDRRIHEERALAGDAREDATLDDYIAKMSGLMIDRGLLKAGPGSAVRQVARTATLATVRRLSGSRKGEVVRFLFEAGLLRVARPFQRPIVDLTGADLRGVDLVNAFFASETGKPTREALWEDLDLRGARFDHARLSGIDFFDDDLRGASFKEALLDDTLFNRADLRGASFERAELFGVKFSRAKLDDAVFDHAIVESPSSFAMASLNNASFVGATFAAKWTSFRCAEGRHVDFSHAVSLSSLDVRYAILADVQMEGVKGRPRGWGPTGVSPKPGTWTSADCLKEP
jgi:uncharacterized protein YjbI with pentapeptide repeats